jgi:GH18 family chitinase
VAKETLKGRYVVEQQLGGAMFWERSNDNGRLLEALRGGLGLVSMGGRPP